MSDPAVYSDHREAEEVGRRLKKLEGALQARAGLAPGRAPTSRRPAATPSWPRWSPSTRPSSPRLEEELRLSLLERDPADEKDVIVEIRPGVGGDEAALWAGDLARMLERYAERRGFRWEQLEVSPSDGGGTQGGRLRDQGRGRLLGLQVRGRHPPRPARPRHRVAGPHPHLDRDRRGDARGRGASTSRSTRRTSRSTSSAPRARAGSRSTRPTPPCASRTCRRASSSRCRTSAPSCRTATRRCACCAPASTRPSARRQAAEQAAARKAQVGSGERAEKIRTYNYPQDRVTDHRVGVSGRLEDVLAGDLLEFTEALDRRRTAARARGRRSVNTGEALAAGAAFLERKGVDTPRLDAELILSRALGLSPARALHRPRPAAQRGRAARGTRAARAPPGRPRAARLRARRVGLPRLRLRTDARALVPRPETEVVVERALAADRRPRGAARGRRRHRQRRHRPRDRRRAPRRARDRDRRLGRGALARRRERRARSGSQLELVETSLLDGLAGPFDLVVSNPPYVLAEELADARSPRCATGSRGWRCSASARPRSSPRRRAALLAPGGAHRARVPRLPRPRASPRLLERLGYRASAVTLRPCRARARGGGAVAAGAASARGRGAPRRAAGAAPDRRRLRALRRGRPGARRRAPLRAQGARRRPARRDHRRRASTSCSRASPSSRARASASRAPCCPGPTRSSCPTPRAAIPGSAPSGPRRSACAWRGCPRPAQRVLDAVGAVAATSANAPARRRRRASRRCPPRSVRPARRSWTAAVCAARPRR